MWCANQKNGTVVYRERYRDPLTEKIKTVSVTKPKDTPQNRNKAQRELAAKIASVISSINLTGEITLQALQREYLAAQSKTCKLSTIKRNEIITSSVINILGDDVIVDNLTAQYVNSRFLNTDKPISTLNTYITRFKAMLNWGYTNDYHDNYKLISKLKPFIDKSQEIDITEKYLETHEVTRLLDYIKSCGIWHWYYATHILILTGLRLGELAALEVTDIDMRALTIKIDKTYDSINDVVTTPKTDNSIRTLHIQPELLSVLKKCLLWRKEMMLERNLRSTLLIPDINTGYYIVHRNYEKYLGDVTGRVLNHRITPHKLRHTHASLLAANGMTPDEIARRLGHARSSVTSDIYIHVTQKVIENDNKKLDAIQLTS